MMKSFTRSYCLLLLEVIATLAVASTSLAQVPQNNLTIGPKTNVNKGLKFNRNSSTPPQIRWNEGAAALQYSNDGTNFASFVSSNTVDMSTALVNLGLYATVPSNTLVVNLADKTGIDPTGASQVLISFRDDTAATGAYSQLSVGSAVSVTVSNGSTLGVSSGSLQYLYVYALKVSTAVELAISATKFDEGSLVSTTAEGGAGGANSAGTMYSTTARTNVPFRLIGRLNIAQAGNWISGPTEIALSPFKTSRSKSAFLTTNTTIRVPAGVVEMRMLGCGGGGGGAGTKQGVGSAGGGGGGGATPQFVNQTVVPGDLLTFTRGAAGTGGPTSGGGAASNGTAGTASRLTGTGVDLTFPGATGGTNLSGSPGLGGNAFNPIVTGLTATINVGGNGGNTGPSNGLSPAPTLTSTTVATGGTGGTVAGNGAGGGGAGGNGFGPGANGGPSQNSNPPTPANATNPCSGGGGAGGANASGGGGGHGSNGAPGAVLIMWDEK